MTTTRNVLCMLAAYVALAMLSNASSAGAFGLEQYDLSAIAENGSAVTQAGASPYALKAEVAIDRTGGEARNLDFELPPGLRLRPVAATQCTRLQLDEGACPDGAAVGVAVLNLAGTMTPAAVYSIDPAPGEPAALGFTVGGVAVIVTITVRTGGDFGLTASMRDLPQREIDSVKLTLWGVPGEASHDAQRGACLTDGETDCAGSEPGVPFLTLPNECAVAPRSTARAYSWEDPVASVSDMTEFEQLSGCDLQSFAPTIVVEPDSSYGDVPAGYVVSLSVPQSGGQESTVAQLENARIALPVGTSLNLGATTDLASCSEAQSALTSSAEKTSGEEDTAMPTCPAAAKVGTFKLDAALVETAAAKEFDGSVYVLQSNPPDVKLLLAASADDVNLKLVASVDLDEQTGQVTLALDELPQLAISDIELELSGGPLALLANPQACGMFTATSELTPWSGGPDASPSSSFAIAAEENSACGTPLPFEPTLSAGSLVDTAGSYSPMVMTVFTHGYEQNLSRLSFVLPPGLEWMLAGVPPCSEPRAGDGTCVSASEIGTATIEAGAGPYPASLIGAVYLTEGYAGGQYGLSIALHPAARPFALPETILRAAIDVNQSTGALSIASDPLPRILDGIPLRVQVFNMTIDRPEFVQNPDTCESRQIAATIEGSQGTTIQASNPFGVAGCQSPAISAIPEVSDGDPTVTTEPAKLSLFRKSVAVRGRGVAAVELGCVGTGTCGGKLTLELQRAVADKVHKIARRTKRWRVETLTVGTSRFSIPAGKTSTVLVKLDAIARELLRTHHGQLGASLEYMASSGTVLSVPQEHIRLIARSRRRR